MVCTKACKIPITEEVNIPCDISSKVCRITIQIKKHKARWSFRSFPSFSSIHLIAVEMIIIIQV